MSTIVEFQRRPSALAYMTGALHRAAPPDRVAALPPLRFVWHGMRIERDEVARFATLTGLAASGRVPVLYLHTVGFRLLMALLTHRDWPLPIWRALQVRNHLVQHRPVMVGEVLELETRAAGHRVLDKGIEVDLRTTARLQDRTAWESIATFYYRGRFGEAGAASPLARAPATGEQELARWRTADGVGLRFGRLTGDYNGIHLWTPYARLSGFRRAFHHPQLVLGQSLARLPALDPDAPQRLDAWLKGPVFYGSEVVLRGTPAPGATVFGLFADGDPRPAIVGRWSGAAEDIAQDAGLAAGAAPLPKAQVATV
ncbi:acyl dehydratase [Ramlibacter sp. RBP-2]|uniref:Acyl dehydratase n=1 Tax=Ramlibacter lithotrophicus TaxID=2606681 RepID=A0A7X6DJE3_9BURK|nr:acyl dehydratase [Ramlibacter lithotrophicus]NKE68263.1 acyl dehydratase [Ramlibacter lithotrophicus]